MTASRSWYAITNRAGEAEVFLYDAIGGPDGVSAKSFIAALKPHAQKPIRLRVNSPGGSVFDAVSIFNALRAHPQKVTAWVDGLAASAASVVVMGAGEIVMPENAMIMVHDPHALVVGSAKDPRGMADALDKVKGSLVSAYRRCGKPDRTIGKWMADETWFTAEEAVAAKLADRLEEPVRIAASFDLSKFGYRRAAAEPGRGVGQGDHQQVSKDKGGVARRRGPARVGQPAPSPPAIFSVRPDGSDNRLR